MISVRPKRKRKAAAKKIVRFIPNVILMITISCFLSLMQNYSVQKHRLVDDLQIL